MHNFAISLLHRLSVGRLLVLGLTCALAIGGMPVQTQAAEQAPPAGDLAIPSLTQRVSDLTATLTPAQQAALEDKLAQFEQQKGSQIAVLLVASTQPETIEQYSMRVAEAWKIGRKGADDGVLVLLALNDRKVRIEVGYGLEGAIPDIYAKRIIRETMAPYFSRGDVYGGLNAGVDQLMALVAGEQLPPAPAQTSQDSQSEHLLPLLLFGALIGGGLLRAMLGRFIGGAATGGLIGVAAMLLGGSILMALVLGFIAFILTMSGALGMLGNMGFGGGGFGRGGGGFSGGGGGFGGGGASGDW